MNLLKSVKSYLRPIKTIAYNRNVVFRSYEFRIGKGSLIKVDKSSKIIFVGRVNIECSVIIRAVEHGLVEVGNNVFIGDYSTIRSNSYAKVEIGDNTMIGQGVKIISTNHAYVKKDILIKEQNIIDDKKGIHIGQDCWIGAGSVILPGVSLGKGVVVGANSVVTKDIPDYAVVAGVPTKVLRYRE